MTQTKTNSGKLPIAVDLDGTLTPTDSLVESLLLLLRHHPTRNWRFISVWLRHGRAAAKFWLGGVVFPDVLHFPWNERLITWLREQKQAGRALYLATAANNSIAQAAILAHENLFD